MNLWLIPVIILLLATLNYMAMILQHRLSNQQLYDDVEGFDNEEQIPGSYPESKGIIRFLDNTELYDEFYASVYDNLTQGSVRTQAEIGLALHEWTKRGEDLKTFSVLDAGCGTGIASVSLAKMNVKNVVGIDKSSAMIKQAKEKTVPQTTLTDEQKEKIEWRTGDLMDPSSSAGGEYTHALLLYFTIYYMPDKETVFRNLFFWVKPGGKLVIHVVNKHKFDPMLESSSPWLGFSLQKYTKERITRSEVVFNKFKYTGEFDLQDPAAEFRETFRFNDKTVRRQKHQFRMEDMKEIVGMATAAGWEYIGNVDLTPVSFEYAYHLHFKHP
jgi:2-polyprenyl-3-methyl-5-hydroxy-6-metoxy-1,4-benzoquinol methylase